MIRSGKAGVHPPRTIKDVQAMHNAIPLNVWGAGDGGFPIDLKDGRVIWFFGDTFTEFNDDTGNGVFSHSTAHILKDGNFRVCNRGSQIVPNDPDNIYFWPTGGVRVGPKRILVTCVAIKHFPDGSWNGVAFKSAYFDVTDAGDLVFDRWLTYWAPYTVEDKISWGTPYIDGTTLVVFGWGDGSTHTKRRIYVSSVPLADVETPSAWSIGTTPLRMEEEAGASCGVRKDGSTWRVITFEPFFSRNLYVYEATSLAGPWTRRILGQVPKVHDTILYVPHWHPEIKLKNGKAVVTVSRQAVKNMIYNNRLLALEFDL